MKRLAKFLCVLSLTAIGAACGGGGGGSAGSPPLPPPPPPPPPTGASSVTVDADIKQLIFSWTEVTGSTHYKLLENPDGSSGFTQVGADIPAGTLTQSLSIAVHFHDFGRALYIVQACDASGCTDSSEVNAMNLMLSTIGYFKASNTRERAFFGYSVSLSADGNTMAVGARDAGGLSSGAVYVFRHDGASWFQQASFSGPIWFGATVSLSADGNTLATGAALEESGATGINGDQSDKSMPGSGAAYVYRFDGTDWFQQAYVKASNTDGGNRFGTAVFLSADGNTLAVGADGEESTATGINGDQTNNTASQSGAAYVFRFDGVDWSQQAYVKASNSEANDRFGYTIALGGDGNTMVVGAIGEDSIATGINGDQADNSVGTFGLSAGAMYVFRFDGTDWFQQAYVKASNTEAADAGGNADQFGSSVALSADGNTLVVGAIGEDSNATGVGGNQNDNSVGNSGAAYVFHFDGAGWAQQAYVKASNIDGRDKFGEAVSLSADGNTLAVGAGFEASNATGVSGDQNDDSVNGAGATYVFRFDGTDWAQKAYVKASNTRVLSFGHLLNFGGAVSLNADGGSMAVGAIGDDSNATGINGNQGDESARASGAVYVY